MQNDKKNIIIMDIVEWEDFNGFVRVKIEDYVNKNQTRFRATETQVTQNDEKFRILRGGQRYDYNANTKYC